jgi:hypothetical protein
VLWALGAAGGVAALLLWSLRRVRRLRSQHCELPARCCEVPNGPERIAELNEATLDLRELVLEPTRVPRVCGRASLSVGMLAALVELGESLTRQTAAAGMQPLSTPPGSMQPWPMQPWSWAIAALLSGVGGAVLCTSLARVAQQEAQRIDAEWKALMRRALTDVAS